VLGDNTFPVTYIDNLCSTEPR